MQSVTLKNISKDYRTNEAYKMLRTNLEFSGSDKRTIVLTSSTPNEGKSTVSLGLAMSLAEGGEKKGTGAPGGRRPAQIRPHGAA